MAVDSLLLAGGVGWAASILLPALFKSQLEDAGHSVTLVDRATLAAVAVFITYKYFAKVPEPRRANDPPQH